MTEFNEIAAEIGNIRSDIETGYKVPGVDDLLDILATAEKNTGELEKELNDGIKIVERLREACRVLYDVLNGDADQSDILAFCPTDAQRDAAMEIQCHADGAGEAYMPAADEKILAPRR